jgi:hypothetical protein
MQERGNPVLSVDTGKKEGRRQGADGQGGGGVKVNSRDFPSPWLPGTNPYGIPDLGTDTALINAWTSHGTPGLAADSVRVWRHESGHDLYGRSDSVLVTAGGGSNPYRSGPWKRLLQGFSDEIGKPVTVCHFPPGTSKWNKPGHRLFPFVSMDRRARPLTGSETIINLIRNAGTGTGLTAKSFLDS